MGLENQRLPRSIPVRSLQTADEGNRLPRPGGETPRYPVYNAQLEYDNRNRQGSATRLIPRVPPHDCGGYDVLDRGKASGARQRLALMSRECELKKAPAACPTAAAPFICLSSCIASCGGECTTHAEGNTPTRDP